MPDLPTYADPTTASHRSGAQLAPDLFGWLEWIKRCNCRPSMPRWACKYCSTAWLWLPGNARSGSQKIDNGSVQSSYGILT
eukprot:2306547-Karenia_brevis.AAC.1